MKKLFSIMLFVIIATFASAQTVTISEADGWIESAYINWLPLENAEKYAVYYSGEGETNKKIDDQLIRNYGSYFRADVLGLKAGTYTFKVAAIINTNEIASSTTEPINIIAHDRSGFAFVNGRIPGAYKADGTPKDNATIIYITEKNKNSISMNVTGANSNPCVGLQTILDGYKKGSDLRPLIIRLIGQITDLSYMLGGDIVIENKNNSGSYITFEGVGNDAVADGWGIRVKGATNIEIRNIGLMNCDSSEGDNIGLQQDNDHIWVHHCDFFYGHAGGDGDQAKGDGALDCKGSANITFSYNHFWDSGKSNLLGNGEGTADMRQTYHHNWYDHSDSRHPRVRIYTAHIYNNYYDGISKYGVGATMGASLFVEKNYFRNCPRPMMISMQGTDTKMGTDEKNAPTFSKEAGGMIKAHDNYMDGAYTFAPYNNENTIHFDAIVTKSKDEIVPSSITTKSGANSYNNFDTNSSIMYNYTPNETSDVIEQVTRYAGRVKGGDFQWTFNNTVDDAAYDLNAPLKAALTSYKTKLIAIQGESTEGGEEEPGGGEEPDGGEITGDIVHNFTTSGLISEHFTIKGSLSTGYGSLTNGELELTQCLKMESSTEISFTLAKEASITLLLKASKTDPNFNGKIKINGVDYTASNGVLTTTLPAGAHKITKNASCYLFYISLNTATSTITPSNSIISLYPNPTTNWIQFGGTEEIHSVKIFSVAGSLVKQIDGNTKSISIGSLSNGSYIIQLHTSNGIIKKLIIKN